MRRTIIFFLIIATISCNKKEKDYPLFDESGLIKPAGVKIYCQHNIDDARSHIEYGYQDGRLSYEKSTSTTSVVEKFYEYNSNSQLINIRQKSVTTYPANSPQHENDVNFPLEYKDGHLYKETTAWGYYIYTYFGDKIAEKKSYINYDNTLTETITFEYEGNRLKKETHKAAPGYVSQQKILTYEYDNMGRVIKIHEKVGDKNSNTVVENSYDGNKLLEKRTYYFGIDPAFDLCWGNYLYVYEY